MSSFMQDIRYALRQLRSSPGFSLAAILTLALGIGANTAIFSAVNGLLLRPLGGIGDFDELVAVYTSDYSGPPYSSSSLPDVRDFAAAIPALSGITGYGVAPVVLGDPTGGTAAELVLAQTVTPNFFAVLKARTMAGRTFAAGEGEPGGRSDVLVLGHSFWQRRFSGDRSVVGRTVRVAGIPFNVIGIAEPGFEGLLPGLSPAFYVPLTAPGISDPRGVDHRGNRGLLVIGRLAPGATLEQARAQFRTAASALHEQYPDHWTDVRDQPRRVTVIPASQATIPPQLRGPVAGFVALLMAIVGGVLLIGCVNIANLLLARATARRREIGVRLAIGAGRGRLVRQLLTESLVLASLGAVLGVALAWLGTRALTLTAADLPLPVDLRLDIAPDLRVLGFAVLVTLLAGALFGLAPALLATRQSLTSALQREESGGRRLGLRGVLAAAQIAITVVLLVAGGLLLRSLLSAQSIEPGFRPDGLLSVSLALDEQARTEEQRVLFQRQLAERVRALPGVTSASYAGMLPLGAGTARRSFGVEGYRPGETEDMEIHSTPAGPDYFRTMGTRLLRGREFAENDGPGAPVKAIVNEAFVSRYLKGQDPLGKRLSDGGDDPLYMQIIGVAENGKYVSLREETRPFVWLSADQRAGGPGFLVLLVRGGERVGRLAQPIRRLVAELDPDVAVTNVLVTDQHLSYALLPQRVGAWLLGLFGLLGLALASLGVYGVMAYAVNQRTREFGVRLALGAYTQDVIRMVVRQGMVVAVAGAAIGMALAAATTRLLRFLLVGVNPLDPVTFTGVMTAVLAVAFVANWLPARRTALVDPLQALRSE